MKKLHLLLFLLLVVTTFSNCKKEEEESEKFAPKQTQYGFAINYTAKWCGPCGSWGAPAIHDLHDVDADKVVAITAHASGDPMHNRNLYYSFSASDQRYTGGGIPSFWVGDTKTYRTSAMTTLLNRTAVAGMDMKANKENGKMKIDAQVKFFEAGSGEYYLSILVLEDGIDGGSSASNSYQQNGTNDPDYKHDFVLRACHVQNNAYGELIATDPEINKTFDISTEIDIDSSWDKVYPVLLLWHKNANNFYEFVNAYK